jgi:hypothetical protein
MVLGQGTLLLLTGGTHLKQRVQSPKINECRERGSPYWFFRYWHDEILPDGTIKTSRKRHIVGPSTGANAITKKQAEGERNKFLAGLNAAPTRLEAAVAADWVSRPEAGAIIFGRLAEMWRKDFVECRVGGKALVAASTRRST